MVTSMTKAKEVFMSNKQILQSYEITEEEYEAAKGDLTPEKFNATYFVQEALNVLGENKYYKKSTVVIDDYKEYILEQLLENEKNTIKLLGTIKNLMLYFFVLSIIAICFSLIYILI